MADKGGVVVTGASTGIGRACVLELHRRGYRVFAGVRKVADGEALVQATSARVTPVLLDVAKPETIASAAAAVDAALGDAPLAALINNAGIGVGGPLEHLPLEDLRWQLEVNVTGQLAVTQAFLPRLRKSRGRILHTGSIGGRVSTPFMGPYCASKFALEALTFALRAELRPWGIQATVIEPGAVQSDIWDKAEATTDQSEARMSPEAVQQYQWGLDATRRFVTRQRKHAIPAQVVVDVMCRALEARTMKARYLAGSEARMVGFLRWLLPDGALEWVLHKSLGM